ncbi:hypothetical protein ABJY94_18460 [Vibrio parahaemolyticus]|uniref:hypothetical protein n=1 Tax=Vibrio parahaemolyticus TaxID=670 RepID=UPI0032AF6A93
MKKFKIMTVGLVVALASGAVANQGASGVNDHDLGTMFARGGFQMSVDSVKQPFVKLDGVPSGSIFAFEGACPVGSLPLDMAGRTIIGSGRLDDGTLDHTYRMGEKGGYQRHQLTLSEFPKHSHGLKSEPDGTGGSGSVRTGPRKPVKVVQTDGEGGGGYHENRMPYMVLNWCVFN